jgi:hypothetical protein
LAEVITELERRAREMSGDVVALLDEANSILAKMSWVSGAGTGAEPAAIQRALAFANVPSLAEIELRVLTEARADERRERVARAKQRLAETSGQLLELGRSYTVAEFGSRFAIALDRSRQFSELDDHASAAASLNDLGPWVSDEAIQPGPTEVLLHELRGDWFWTAADVFGANSLFENAMTAYRRAVHLADGLMEGRDDVVNFIALKMARKALDLSHSGLSSEANLEEAAAFLRLLSPGARDSPEVLGLRFQLETACEDYPSAVSILKEAEGQAAYLRSVSAFERARVVLLAELPAAETWKSRFGPFAVPIYAECRGITSAEAGLRLGDRYVHADATGIGAQALLYGRVCICERMVDQVAIGLHENLHDEVRSGAVHRVGAEWLAVARDVPTAALGTYLQYLSARGQSEQDAVALTTFVDVGRESVRAHPAAIDAWVGSMLSYFDSHREESEATYQCAAILAGIVLELLGEETARRYASHLALTTHREALALARRAVDVYI